jgi:hypothetical protein
VKLNNNKAFADKKKERDFGTPMSVTTDSKSFRQAVSIRSGLPSVPIEPIEPTSGQSTQKLTLGISTSFNKQAERNKQMPKRRIIKRPTPSNNEGVSSILSLTMQNLDPNDFYLPPPDKSSHLYLKCKIFFFNSPKQITIEIMQNDKAKDVIRHCMTLYRKSEF